MNNLKKLMIIDEDENLQMFHYRIACCCEHPDDDLSFDIFSDTVEAVKGSGKYEVVGWEFSFDKSAEDYLPYWRRAWNGIKLLFGYKLSRYDSFLLDNDNIAAIEYVFAKYKEINRQSYWNLSTKFSANHIDFNRLLSFGVGNSINKEDSEHLTKCSLCRNILSNITIDRDLINKKL